MPTPAKFESEEQVREFFRPLDVTKVYHAQSDCEPFYRTGLGPGAYEVHTNSTYRQVGKFLFENGLLERCGGSGSSRTASFYLDHPPWAGQLPKSWLPKAAGKQDDYHPSVVECKKLLTDAGYECSYLRNGTEHGVKVTDSRVHFNLAFVEDSRHPGLKARLLTNGETFSNRYYYRNVSVHQAVELTLRATKLFDCL